MTRVDWKKNLQILVLASAALGASSATSLSDTEYCILCNAPDASYRCVLGAPDPASAGAALQCIKQLAKTGGHQSCSVRRGDSAHIDGVCQGEVVVVVPEPGSLHAAPHQPPPASPGLDNSPYADEGPHPIEQALPADQSEEPQPEDNSSNEPKTVEELARRTAKSTQDGIKSAGDAVVDTAKNTGKQIQNAGKFVGGAVKKTWDCVTSLFSDC